MAPVTITKELPLAIPPPKIWEAIKDTPLLPKALHPIVVSVEVEEGPQPIGSTRTIHFNPEIVGFPYVKEKLVAYDESSLTIGSSVVEGGYVGTQLKSHVATITVKPDGEGCILVWVLEYEPLVEKPDIDNIVEGFVKSFKAIEAYLLKN